MRGAADFLRVALLAFAVFFGCLTLGAFLLAFLTAARKALCAFLACFAALRAAFFAALNACFAVFNLVFACLARALAASNRPSASRTPAAAADTWVELSGESVDLRNRFCMAVTPR